VDLFVIYAKVWKMIAKDAEMVEVMRTAINAYVALIRKSMDVGNVILHHVKKVISLMKTGWDYVQDSSVA
jgi:hypothetical protein